ncbi:MAG: hypothetical protein IPO32_11295 [Crocinitomicaceae bacterium]|nr:hypothetical protein [Crocinitomicaceae bacterium]MBK9592057.1 hypothetical protein [Crocinitomicaceae bacterium]
MAHAHSENENLSGSGLLNKIFYDQNTNRYGIISILLLFVGCGGGIAVGLGALDSVIQLILLVVPTMIALSMILAVAPMKAIIYTSVIAFTIDILVIVYNAIM